MANLQNFRNYRKPSYLETIGQTATNIAEFGMAMKKVYDVGKMMYQGFEAAAPLLEVAFRAGL